MGARIAWQSAGEKFIFTSGRACGIILGTEAGDSIGVASTYLPSGSGAANLDEAHRSVRVLCERLQKEVGEQYFILGDWNAHIGRDTMSDDTHVGNYAMQTNTTAGGRRFLNWIRTTNLTKVGSYHRIRNRGTWRHKNSKWYEIDFMCTPMIMVKSTDTKEKTSSGSEKVSEYSSEA
eukprot:6890515-Pyramimonas_sp.AAC.1